MPPGLWARFKQAIASAAPVIGSRRVLFSGIVFLCVITVLVVVVCSRYKSNSLSQTASSANSSSATPAQPISAAPPASVAQSMPQPAAKPSPLHRDSAAKPSPFHRSQTQRPAPRVVVPHTTTAAPAARNDSEVASAPVAPPVESLAPSLPFGVRMTANRDGFSNGCKHGRLVIEASTITFTCPDNPSKNVSVSVRQVKNLDDNGIVVFPRQKYHFDIAGKQKQDVHNLFAQWLENARRGPSIARN